MKEEVILVDTSDNPIGTMPKMEAHEKAALHRAFSVFIINKEGQLMVATTRFTQVSFPRTLDQYLL